ncbi:MAG: alpha/beta hydrolase [Paralcaligenes sp.]
MSASRTIQNHFADLLIRDKAIQLEYQWIAPDLDGRPLIVFLHEGLGSVALWKNWPEQLCRAVNCRGLVFSRYGYGQSTQRSADEKYSTSYLHDEARLVLPALFKRLHINTDKTPPILFGHSDGATIALLFAAMYPQAAQAIIVAAPHIFVEDVTIANIRIAREAYLNTDLPTRLQRYHRDPDSAFWGWNDIWLSPEFRSWNIESCLSQIRCPILAIQGVNDEYATLEQIHGIKRHAPQAELCIIPDCAHSPHNDQPEKVIKATGDFIRSLR